MNKQSPEDRREFRRIVERARSQSHDPVGDEIRELLKDKVRDGVVEIHVGNQQYFDLIEKKYPISVNRIAWSRVGESKSHNARELEGGQVTEACIQETRRAIENWFDEWDVNPEDPAVLFGDDSKIAIHLSVEDFLDMFDRFYAMSQHVYVTNENLEWCVQLCLELYVCGGLAVNSEVVGWLDGG